MTARRFAQVDVFAERSLAGNPLAVVLDPDGLSDDDFAAFARWTNLSETTFVLPPTDARADYAVRIFTPESELPFAGHPTLGTAHAWLAAGGSPKDTGLIVQECGVGLVDIRRDGERLAFRAPELRRSGPLDAATLDRIVAALGIETGEVIDHSWADNGPHWACVRLRDVQRVLDLEPELTLAPDLEIGVVGLYPAGERHAYEVRAFAHTLPGGEDPVTGSLNAGIAQWLSRGGVVSGSWTAGQGTRRHRDGVVHLTAEPDGTVWVGGAVRTIVNGTATLM